MDETTFDKRVVNRRDSENWERNTEGKDDNNISKEKDN